MLATLVARCSVTSVSFLGGVTISMLSIRSSVRSKITGLLGADSNTETVVASYGLLSKTVPIAVMTSISPLESPY